MESIHQLVSEQASFISRHQLPSGAIPWYEGGITDPWDQVECAIALDLAGRFDEAAKAYGWLRDIQNADGSWYLSYLNDQPQDLTRDTNCSSYIATGVWHHYLVTKEKSFLRHMWTTIDKGIDFALHLQQPTGEIYWACDANDKPWPRALLAASSCIWRSIGNGINIADSLELEKPDWYVACGRLVRAMREHPELFDGSADDKYNYAMSWYYPILTGVIKGKKAKEHILKQWSDFVIDGWGCKCVVEAPWWVTTAETCELILALTRIGEHDGAKLLLDWIFKLRDYDGSFWTGMKLPEQMIWPEGEKPTWVSAAVIMAVSNLK